MLIACQAWEGMYQGLHGIESLAVLEVKDIKDARNQLDDWGNTESEELIYSYGLEDEYLNEMDFWNDSEDVEDEYDITESNYYYDRGWRGYVIKPDAFTSEQEADKKLCALGFDVFREEYCDNNEIE